MSVGFDPSFWQKAELKTKIYDWVLWSKKSVGFFEWQWDLGYELWVLNLNYENWVPSYEN